MFNFFKSSGSVGQKSYIGVDIGTTSIKIVELAGRKGEKPTLKNYGTLEGYGYLERINNAIQTSNLKMMEKDVVQLLTLLLKQLKIETKDAIASIPSFSTFTTLLDIPEMSKDETAQAVEYQAQAYVPVPISDVVLDYTVINRYEDERGVKKQQIFLVSVQKDIVKRYQDIFKLAGLNLKVLEVEGLSLARVVTTGDPTTTLIIDIGGRSTTLAVTGGGFLKYNTQIDYAGGSLTQAVASGLNINVRRAEELKKQRGMAGTGGEYELSTLMAPFLDAIIGEAKRVKYSYEKDYKARVERIVLAGGGANLKGIEEYVSREFQLPAVKADPLQRVNYPPNLAPVVKEIGAQFAVSFGLALKEFI